MTTIGAIFNHGMAHMNYVAASICVLGATWLAQPIVLEAYRQQKIDDLAPMCTTEITKQLTAKIIKDYLVDHVHVVSNNGNPRAPVKRKTVNGWVTVTHDSATIENGYPATSGADCLGQFKAVIKDKQITLDAAYIVRTSKSGVVFARFPDTEVVKLTQQFHSEMEKSSESKVD